MGCARHVVIVEDSEDSRFSLQKILEHEGHTVHTAIDGQSGFDVIARMRPDVAVIDIGLPGLDGYGLAAQMRSIGLRTYLIALDRLWSRRGPQARPRGGLRRTRDQTPADGPAARIGRVRFVTPDRRGVHF